MTVETRMSSAAGERLR